MKCKHCGEKIPKGSADCPACGRPIQAQPQRVRRRVWLYGAGAVLAVLATVLFLGIRSGWQLDNLFSSEKTVVTDRDSYSVSDRKAMRKRNQQVAFMGDAALTNGQLQIYYWTEVYDFIENYSYYLTAFGLDLSQPLDQQKLDPENGTLCYLIGNVDGNMTWEQYFLQGAIQRWQSDQAFAQLAREKGFVMDAESKRKLQALPDQLAAEAKKGGFATVDAYLQDAMGPGCTQEDYLAYMETYYLGYSYFASLYHQIDPTQDQLETYFAENEETLRAYGITKSMGYTVDVRHILITPSGRFPTQEEAYTDAQWEACRIQAQEILDLFEAGDRSEDSFSMLARLYSQDAQENVAAGGLYTYVQAGEMEGEFNTWCFAEDRQPGHYGVVKTSFGYHIIYFVGSQELWVTQTRNLYIREESQKIVNATLDSHPIRVDYSKIVLGKVEVN